MYSVPVMYFKSWSLPSFFPRIAELTFSIDFKKKYFQEYQNFRNQTWIKYKNVAEHMLVWIYVFIFKINTLQKNKNLSLLLFNFPNLFTWSMCIPVVTVNATKRLLIVGLFSLQLPMKSDECHWNILYHFWHFIQWKMCYFQ